MARATEALAGLGVAALLFAGARALLQDSARAEPFRVEVEAPARIVASSERLRWQGTVRPAALAGRVELWVDGLRVTAREVAGRIDADLHGIGPGHHLVELAVT